MNNEEFCQIVEWEGWLYVLLEVDSSEIEDDAISEALSDVQTAFKYLRSIVPDIELDIDDEDSDLELLDFGD
jgi:hypothetical protein